MVDGEMTYGVSSKNNCLDGSLKQVRNPDAMEQLSLMRHGNKMTYQLICIGCGRTPNELDEYKELAEAEGMTPGDYVKEEEGTYNPENGHFLCTACYVKYGMPSSPTGWKAP